MLPTSPQHLRPAPLPRAALAAVAGIGVLLGISPGCGDGGSGDAGTVNLSASQEAAAKKGAGDPKGIRGGSLSGKPLTARKAR